MKVTAHLKSLRIAPRKVRLVSSLIRGMDAEQAQIQLDRTVKRSSDSIAKLLASAIANAEHNLGLDRNNLYVYDIQVGDGPRLKRWLPRAFGRATLLLKRTSRLTITLEERVEGKNRKSAEQLKKERDERTKEKEKMRKEMQKEAEALESEKKEQLPGQKVLAGKSEKKESKGNWAKKIFQRKSA